MSIASVTSTSSSPSTTIDDETKRRKILSKLWGKGNKSSHKVRELEKSTTNISNDHDQQQLNDHLSSYSSTNDQKSTSEDNSNSINSKPLAVVKPIVLAKSTSSGSDRARINSETSSVTITQTDEGTASIAERVSSSNTAASTEDKSSKKKKSHKHESSKKKKTTRDKSHERDRSKDRHRHHNHHQVISIGSSEIFLLTCFSCFLFSDG